MPVKYQIWRVDPVGVSLVGENRADTAVLSAEIVIEIKLIVPEYDRLIGKLTCTEPADDIRIDLVKLTEALRYLESCVDASCAPGDWGAWYSSASSAAFAASCLRISTVPVRDDESTANVHSEAINSTLYLPPRRFPGRRFSVSFVCMSCSPPQNASGSLRQSTIAAPLRHALTVIPAARIAWISGRLSPVFGTSSFRPEPTSSPTPGRVTV